MIWAGSVQCRWRLRCCVMAALLCGVAQASAQDYPARPVRIIAPFAAGGGADLAARAIRRRRP